MSNETHEVMAPYEPPPRSLLQSWLAAPWAVAKKELRQTLRDPRVMAVLVIAPALQLLVLGHAANLEVDRVPTVIVDLDDTTDSRRALAELIADDTLREVARAHSPDEATALLVQGRASVAIVVPDGWSRDLHRAVPTHPARVQVLVDGTDPNRSGIAGSAALRFFSMLAARSVQERLAQMQGSMTALAGQSADLGTVTASAMAAAAGAPSSASPSVPSAMRPTQLSLAPRVLYNPRLRTAYNMVPGIATMLLLIVTTIVTSMGLARERESGTLEQVLVTPVRPWALILGKMLPFAGIGLFDLLLALVVGTYVFDVPIRGSIPLLFGVTFVYLLTTLGLGLLISTVSQTQQQAFLAGLFVMMPGILLSGIMTPIESMPSWLQPVTYLNPLRWFSQIVRAVMIRGATLDEILGPLGALAVCGFVLATVAILRFRKTAG
ncbi:MAG: ABC transporter permease [Sandaracinaceae bacterium]|nr:ABC transporter permease [Sandaracinaceae bacterium]